MHIEYTELMEILGIGHILSAYETRPWFFHDSKQGIMCSAEIRVGPDTSDIEAEIQFMYDEEKWPGGWPNDEEETDDDSDDDDDDNYYGYDDDKKERAKHGPRLGQTGPEQVMFMRFVPNNDNIWQGKFLFVRGEDYHSKIRDWDERGAAFFYDFISALQMEELPDVDALIEEHLVDSRRSSRGKRGRVGKKGFKVEQKGITMGMRG
ncbi:MAG: hypothetical protein KAJ40_01640 [Alphaproteobacteria bacterium]|nr:hypothetical protein [Alphaproteobacteria bacterium]